MVDLNLNMNIPPPSNFEQVNQTTQQQAETLSVAYPELSEDQIVDLVNFYNENGIPVDNSTLQNMQADSPVLNQPPSVDGVMTEVVKSSDNPWLSPNPFATFFVLFLELQSKLSEIKELEGEVMAGMINTTLDMAEDLAGIVKEIYENEAEQAIISGVINLASGVASIGCSAMAFKNLSGAKAGDAGIGRATAWGSMGSGIGQVGTAIDKFVSAGFSYRRAELEYSKTIIENAIKVLQDRGMSSAAEAQKTADELISQILQKLDKIIDEAYRAHGFQVH